MDERLNMLLNPPFAKDPPVKLSIPAKTLGLVYAIVGAIFGVFGLFGVLGLLGLSGALAYAGVGNVLGLIVIGSLVNVAGTLLAAWGGYQMYQGNHGGKRLAIYGLALTAVGSLISALGSGGLVSWVIGLAVTFVLYYLVIVSTFEGEAKPA